MSDRKADESIVAPPLGSLNSALSRNIESLRRRHEEERSRATVHERMAQAITRFTGSFAFVYLHLFIVAGWVAANVGVIPGVKPWDPSFVILATVASVEAIFLSTFVLISQNQMAAENDRQSALDLQISLLAEHEVTRLIHMTSEIAAKLGVGTSGDIEELKRDVQPEAVLDAIKEAER